jgi:hypothetical protein
VGHGGVPGARALVPAARLAPAINVDEERRRRARRVAALPTAGAPQIAGGLSKAVREAGGFNASAVDGRPGLVRELDDGSTAIVQPEPGKSFADAAHLVARIVSPDGERGPDIVLSRMEDVEAFLEFPSTPAP